jgi:rubrerythrin
MSCLSKAVTAEETVHNYYLKMAEHFQNQPHLKSFLLSMAEDETQHAETLRQSIKNENHSEKIHGKSRKIEKQLEKIAKDVGHATQKIPSSFLDVYEFSREIENDELNGIFTFFVTETMDANGNNLGYVLASLKTHIAKVNLFDYGDNISDLKKFKPIS